MSRHLGPKCKLCRRSRVKLFLKGERCHTAKCAIEKRNVPPGPQGNMQKKMGEYAIRLREKQKMRFFYGVSERQMQGYFERASRAKGVTGYNLVSLFERRLDNILHRSGLAASRQDARQMVVHGHFRINARKVSIPSQLLKVGDEVYVQIGDQTFKYIVQYSKIVSPHDISVLSPLSSQGKNLTLMTCVPPGTSTKRLVVITSLI